MPDEVELQFRHLLVHLPQDHRNTGLAYEPSTPFHLVVGEEIEQAVGPCLDALEKVAQPGGPPVEIAHSEVCSSQYGRPARVAYIGEQRRADWLGERP